ncbi:MAG: 4-(cytidine 5'-diphospho)-2-C-methyl-D-erythritol kinase [Planctomycetota bacterium]|jgi:4-diphosphocytidyl-2-C-methyl-D-erythritol kinase
MTAGRLALAAPAKVNLALAVLGRRDDGFHELVTVMHTVDLCDEIALTVRDRTPEDEHAVTLELTGPHAEGLGEPRSNLAVRAAEDLLRRAGREADVRVHIALDKRIPAGGGLGGGSSDAASVLVGLNRLLDEPCTPEALQELAAALGSDVPFFLHGGCALCSGRGEIVRPIEAPRPFEVTLVMPGLPLSTAAVYAALAQARADDRSAPDTDELVARIAGADAATLESLYFNDLQPAAIALQPELGEWTRRHGLHLSGSGSTLFAFGDRSSELAAACPSALICSAKSTSGKH